MSDLVERSRALREQRLAICLEDVMHEVIKIDGNTLSVVLACAKTLAVLVHPDTEVHALDNVDVDCMTCLATRSSL